MAKTKTLDPYAKRAGENDLQWRSRVARFEQDHRDRSEPLVPAEAMKHGAYGDEFVLHAETGTKVQTKLNRGGSPVMRWTREGRLSDTQMLAIAHCLHLWGLTGTEGRVTSHYGERIGGSDHENERRANTIIEAMADLRRIMAYIPGGYFGIFENVCRFDEPAGIAGQAIGYSNRANEARAHTIVCMVADLIAMREGLIPTTRIRVA